MNYTYANSYLKAIESKLLDKNKFEKLCNTEKEDLYQVLLDFGYGASGSNVEELIESELSELRNLIDELTPEKKYTDLFFIFIDAINIKTFYKMKLFAKSQPNFYTEGGNLSKTELQKAIFENDYSSLSKTYQKFLIKLAGELEDVKTARSLSAKIDNAIFRFVDNQLKLTPKQAVKTYFSVLADQKNVLSLIRSRNLNWEYHDFQEMYLGNGEIKLSVFKDIYFEDMKTIIRVLKDYYQSKLSIGLERYLENTDLDALEKYFDHLLLEIMKTYQDDALSIGPMLYYYLLKQMEAKNIKIIYATDKIDLSGLIEY